MTKQEFSSFLDQIFDKATSQPYGPGGRSVARGADMLAPMELDPELPRRQAFEDKIRAVQNRIHSVDSETYQAIVDDLQADYDKFGWTEIAHIGTVNIDEPETKK